MKSNKITVSAASIKWNAIKNSTEEVPPGSFISSVRIMNNGDDLEIVFSETKNRAEIIETFREDKR